MESDLGRKIQVALSAVGARIFRNNVALGWVSSSVYHFKHAGQTTISVKPGDLLMRQARPLHAGLCEGSGDYVGWFPLEITADMVGKKIPVFTSVEVKTAHGRLSGPQINWIQAVKDVGGIAFMCRSEKEAVEKIMETPCNKTN